MKSSRAKGNAEVKKSVEAIEWFHQNLELLLEDVELGDQVELCFDAWDFTKVVLGVYGLYEWDRKTGARTFSWDQFKREDETVLVHCLATAGWLDTITLLPPHQAEFLALVEREFGLGDIGESPRELARKFLREGQENITPGLDVDLETLERLEGDELVKTFSGKAELAKEIFKLLQCIKGSWRTRLVEWNRQGVFEEIGDFDPSPYLDEEVFLAVKRALDVRRGRRFSMSNFSDALAVAILARRTRDFQQKSKGAKLSLFFDHAGRLGEAIHFAGVEDALEYRTLRDGHEKTFSVLRDWRYCFFRATFGHRGKAPHSPEELRELLEQAENIRKGQEKVAKQAVEALGPSGSNVDQQIEYMQEFQFFNSWLRSGKGDVQRVLEELDRANLLDKRLRETVKDLRSEELQEKFEEAQRTVRQNFEHSVGTYQRARRLLEGIDTRSRKISQWLKARQGVESDQNVDMMLILGLFRFPFPAGAYRKIDATLRDLTSGTVEKQIEAQKTVFSALYEVESGQRLNPTQLAFVLGMLWATELDREIVELARRQQILPAAARSAGAAPSTWSISFSLVLAAALVRDSEEKRHLALLEGGTSIDDTQRQAEQIKQAYQLLKEIVQAYDRIPKGDEKARLAVGIAYLDFHLFATLCSAKLSPWLEPGLGEKVSPLSLLTDAIGKARSAWETPELDERLRVYALNQVLYYLADGVLRKAQDFKTFESQLDEAASALLAFEGRAGWHYRYDDSLARYYETSGMARNDRQAWERGRNHVERAFNDCFDDPLIAGSRDSGSKSPGDRESKGYYREFTERYDAWQKEHPEAQ